MGLAVAPAEPVLGMGMRRLIVTFSGLRWF